MAVPQKTGISKWLALASGTWTKTCGLPLLFNFEPHMAQRLAKPHLVDACGGTAGHDGPYGAVAFRRSHESLSEAGPGSHEITKEPRAVEHMPGTCSACSGPSCSLCCLRRLGSRSNVAICPQKVSEPRSRHVWSSNTKP